jgi:hypothetical protein
VLKNQKKRRGGGNDEGKQPKHVDSKDEPTKGPPLQWKRCESKQPKLLPAGIDKEISALHSVCLHPFSQGFE